MDIFSKITSQNMLWRAKRYQETLRDNGSQGTEMIT